MPIPKKKKQETSQTSSSEDEEEEVKDDEKRRKKKTPMMIQKKRELRRPPPSEPEKNATWPEFAFWCHEVFEYLLHSLREMHYLALKAADALPLDNPQTALMKTRELIVLYTKALFWSGSYETSMMVPSSNIEAVTTQVQNDLDADFMEPYYKASAADMRRLHARTVAERWLEACGTFDASKFVGSSAADELRASTKETEDLPTKAPPGQEECLKEMPLLGDRDITTLEFCGVEVKIRADALARLRDRFFEKNGVTDEKSSLTIKDYLLGRAFAMLLRYQDLARGDAGQHGVLPKPAFEVLKKWGCRGECFATPFNATLKDYCSPFLDTDDCFGSSGSFFKRTFHDGCFEVNPPFSFRDDRVKDHLAACLHDAQTNDRPLAFVFVHTDLYARLLRSDDAMKPFIRKIQVFHGLKHYYYEGAFFQRATPRAYVPTSQTTVLFIMTDAALQKWPITDPFINDFRNAFAWPIVV